MMSWNSIRNPYQGETIITELDRVIALTAIRGSVTAVSTGALMAEAKKVLTGETEYSDILVSNILERANASKLHERTLRYIAKELEKVNNG